MCVCSLRFFAPLSQPFVHTTVGGSKLSQQIVNTKVKMSPESESSATRFACVLGREKNVDVHVLLFAKIIVRLRDFSLNDQISISMFIPLQPKGIKWKRYLVYIYIRRLCLCDHAQSVNSIRNDRCSSLYVHALSHILLFIACGMHCSSQK